MTVGWTADGRDVVLKIDPPDPDLSTAGQVRTLAAAGGSGYVVLLAHDLERRTLLLEALGAQMSRSGLAPERQLELLCAVLARAWRVPRPDGAKLEQAREKAGALAELVGSLWEDLGRPCSEHVVALALEYAKRRRAGTDLNRAVVVHGDPHPDNALQVLTARPGAEPGFVFVDPDGFLADPAYDLGVVLRGWCEELLVGDADGALATARRYCRLLADRSGLDETAVWEWGFLERVSTGLYLLELGADDLGRKYLESAERLASPRHQRPGRSTLFSGCTTSWCIAASTAEGWDEVSRTRVPASLTSQRRPTTALLHERHRRDRRIAQLELTPGISLLRNASTNRQWSSRTRSA